MADARTLPWSWYDDRDVLARERERLFDPSWQYVGHTAMFGSGASYFPAMAGGLPVIVTRDDGGALGAVLNVCAHRGSIIRDEPGEGTRLQCPYHAWTYRLDGSLVAAPRSDREPGFDPGRHGLEALAAAAWGPFVFVCARGDAPPLLDALGDIPERVADLLDVDDLVFRHRATTTYRANWKVCVENYLECYHCRVAHPSFVQVVDTRPDDYRLVTSPVGSSQYGPVRRSWSGGFDPVGPVGRSQFHLFHPNTTINIFPGRPNMSIGPVLPDGTGRTTRFLDYFFASGVDEAWIEALIKLDDEVGREDLALVESVQRGMEARARSHGTLFLDSEGLIAHFRDYVRGAIDPQ